MNTINVRTDQSKRKIVIRTPPKDAAQCFDVACENAMAKMENSPTSQCLYLHKTENEADDVTKSQSVYDTVESEFYSLIIAECQKECTFLDYADLEESHWQRGAVSEVLWEVLGTAQSRSKMSTHKQKTRTRELYSRERPNDDGDVTSGGGPDGERTWLKFIAEVHCLGRSRVLLRTSYCGPQTIRSSLGPGGVDR